MKSRCGDSLYWHNCYKGGYDLIAPESMAHPAKMAPTVGFRILEHLEELGLLNAGDTVLDPMAGTGLTNICAGAKGYRSISVELEAAFIEYQNQNKGYAERRLFKALDWQIVKGDSRELSALLSEKGLVSLTSPPYAEAVNAGKGGIDWEKAGRPDRLPENEPAPSVQGTREWRYSEDDANIGNLPDRPFKSIMSPPYENALESGSRHTKGGIAGRDPQLAGSGRYGVMADGQIGQEKDASYLSEMLKVYQEIAAVSDILAVVIKNPTRNKQLRRLDFDTIKLLELAGWTIHCQHRALLFEELEQATLFGGTAKKIRGRMSFFKRLSWQNGQPVASWEDIIIATKGEG